jgi:hypothetical protein
MKMASLSAVMASAAALLACQVSTGPEAASADDPALRTDRSAYGLDRGVRSWATEIPYAFVNRTGRTVYLTNCNGGFALRLEKWQDGAWVPAWSPVRLLCLSAPLEIAPGATFEDTVRVNAGLPDSNTFPKFEVDEVDGAYRLVWLAGTHDYDHDDPGGPLIDAAFRTSNTFTLAEE